MSVPKTGLTITGAILAAAAASACCLGPLILTILGIGGAASALVLAPYRPYLIVITVVLLGAAFYITYRRRARACAPGEACEIPAANRTGKVLLWVATVLILLAIAFPFYSLYLF